MFDYGVDIHRRKKKDVMYLSTVHKGMSKIIINVKNKSWISLVKLVVTVP